MQHDPAIIAGVCLAIESTIARALVLSPGTQIQLAALHPTKLAIKCLSPSVELSAIIGEQGDIRISSYCETEPTVTIEGTWRDFLSVASADDPASALINGDIRISGDTVPLMQLQNIISDLDIDWESPLVDLLGSVVGHQVANVIRAVSLTSKNTHQRLRRQLSEFILEEGRLSPPKAELNAFFTSVDDMVLRVDRAESRIKRLKTRLAALSGN